ncbi:MAG: hypothetical protein LN546_03465 [Rickettsia endosymbiont of Ecitomorpha arachnoides]|nr:hypothetical protein [Rickettsia endosymbiont of Ecitomorpha arachnoides]
MKNIFCKFVFAIFLCLINLQLIAASFNEKIPLYFKLTNENLLAGQNSLNIDLCDSRQDLRYVIGNMLNTLITKLCFYSGSLHNIP